LVDDLLDVGVDLVPAGGGKVRAADPGAKYAKGGARREDVASVEAGYDVRVRGYRVFSRANGQDISFLQVELRAQGEGGKGHGGVDQVQVLK
jgi:hypothetical protein